MNDDYHTKHVTGFSTFATASAYRHGAGCDESRPLALSPSRPLALPHLSATVVPSPRDEGGPHRAPCTAHRAPRTVIYIPAAKQPF